MKLIPLKGGDEYDCLTRGGKRYVCRSPKIIKYVKRKFNKRFRKDGKKQCLLLE